MLPEVSVFGRTITMYGLMIALGLIIGISVAVVRSKKQGLLRVDALFASMFGAIGLFAGAKLLYILVMLPELVAHMKDLLSHPSLLRQLFTGGYIFYGGLLGAIAGYYIYCRCFGLPFIRMLDLIAPSVPLTHAFGRLGCFFAGCCYGIRYSGPGHIVFHLSDIAPKEVPLFPTQPLESCLNLLAAGVLLLYEGKFRKPGRVFGIYLAFYTIMRFCMEFLRGDAARGYMLGLSTSQWISLALLPVGIWFICGIRADKATGNSSINK